MSTQAMDPETAEPALKDVQAEFPAWYAWRGIAGLLYARRLNSTPPRIVRAEDADDLRDQIVSQEADIEVGVPFGLRHGAI